VTVREEEVEGVWDDSGLVIAGEDVGGRIGGRFSDSRESGLVSDEDVVVTVEAVVAGELSGAVLVNES
jgi:hypothetical protein